MNRKYIEVLDMTKLFKKEILLYSLFDIHFKTPVRLMMGVYLGILGVIWTFPILYFFSFTNKYVLTIALGIPFLLANAMSKPIWGGKSFFAWLKTQIIFILNPKEYYDTIARGNFNTYQINNEYTVSRTRDYLRLLELERENAKCN